MLGPHAELRDVVELGVEDILQYDPYEDKLQNAKTFPMLVKEPEVRHEWGSQYMNADILLPRDDKMTTGQLVCQKQNACGILIGRSNQNPIFDT